MKRTSVRKKEQSFEKKTIKTLEILDFLAAHPYDSFSLNDLARQAHVSKSLASKAVQILRKDDLAVVEPLANLIRIRFKRENIRAVGYKIGMNLARVYSSGIVDFIVHKWGAPKAIILFGSVRTGQDNVGSDIDLAIEIDRPAAMEITSLDSFQENEAQEIRTLEHKLGRKFKLHFFHRSKIDQNLFVNIANGIVLFGLLEVNP